MNLDRKIEFLKKLKSLLSEYELVLTPDCNSETSGLRIGIGESFKSPFIELFDYIACKDLEDIITQLEKTQCQKCMEKEIVFTQLELCSDCGAKCTVCGFEGYKDEMTKCVCCEEYTCGEDECTLYAYGDPQEDSTCANCGN